ncbi:MAG TPA: C45 family peptidase [Woeseiaceae bacterium]|nr:C45 family peptidase [Woeseiaceae bacterium]
MNTTPAFPVVSVSGPPRERGLSYGRQAGERIAAGVATYKEAFAVAGIEWSEAMGYAERFRAQIRGYDSDMYAEIEGIAGGSDQPLNAIVALNARTEIIYWRDKERQEDRPAASAAMQEECTAALALPGATANGHVLHGQNWDWNPRCADSSVVLRIENGDGPDILTFVEAGQLARHGMNSEGIALTVNGLQCDLDCGNMGVPNPLIRRRLLQSRALGGAIDAVLNTPISFSHSLMLSHSAGAGVTLEVTPAEAFWLQPDQGILVHANHFKSPVARSKVRDTGLLHCPESLYRDQRLLDHLRARQRQITVETFKAGLADTFGAPDAILRTPKARAGGNLSGTVATLIMDTTARKMWLAPRPYLGIEFTEYSL